jgi:glyoxylase-like metal-dependent hydrolase (beta-lactamase superfamily II)
MRLGGLRLHVVSDGEFRLDGGAMFGVVPKVLWSGLKEPDEQNRIRMTTNCLLVESGSDLVLVDTGVGDKLDDRAHQIFGLRRDEPRLPDRIAEAGYQLGDVTHVLQTHLHFDHCGWCTRRDGDSIRPTFPNARYWISRLEVEHARMPNVRDRSSYLPENWEPLFEEGLVELFEDEAEPVPGVRAVRAGGHSPGMCIVILDGGEGRSEASGGSSLDRRGGVFFADLVPTTAHVPYSWIMAFDLEPMKTLAAKQRWIPEAAARDWLCIFEHDADEPVGRIAQVATGRFVAEPAAGAQ